MLTVILHTLFLALAVSLTFFWTKNPILSAFNLQFVGLIILFYFLVKLISKRQKMVMALDALVFAMITFLIVSSTGGLRSPAFFLLYFLLFSLSLLFEPIQSLLLGLFLALLFSLQAGFAFDTTAIINLTTLILITPLALIFGRKYLQTLADLGKIKLLNDIVSEEETDMLIWLSTKAKPTLVNLLDTTSLIISSNLLPFGLQEKLKTLHSNLISLHQSANELEKDIDEKTD